ncbi:Crp/Fnr family transcriptional regulator [Massilia arenosa]|uniref:Crp/Fnr family transcriptional regulator n=1 Tax=Zemynaea arenosa TaxID=2561931 RepID=A0A4Y9S6P9_9BURK|nr:Crp/Fnr family transcriptional regulator [Massilia arenosa]TFW17157.1 Crp/Fnr family transcriptional regulator [Massilia arenosa]
MSLRAALLRFEETMGFALPGAGMLAAAIQVQALNDRQAAFNIGDANARVYCVREGLFKQLYVTESGVERIKSFTAEGDLFACPFALRAGGRTQMASVAIGPAVVESIAFARLEELGARELAWQTALRHAFQRLAELKVQRERELLTMSAAQLYQRFAHTQPALLARVPQKDLASYFGVTPVGLNRIIRRLRAGA